MKPRSFKIATLDINTPRHVSSSFLYSPLLLSKSHGITDIPKALLKGLFLCLLYNELVNLSRTSKYFYRETTNFLDKYKFAFDTLIPLTQYVPKAGEELRRQPEDLLAMRPMSFRSVTLGYQWATELGAELEQEFNTCRVLSSSRAACYAASTVAMTGVAGVSGYGAVALGMAGKAGCDAAPSACCWTCSDHCCAALYLGVGTPCTCEATACCAGLSITGSVLSATASIAAIGTAITLLVCCLTPDGCNCCNVKGYPSNGALISSGEGRASISSIVRHPLDEKLSDPATRHVFRLFGVAPLEPSITSSSRYGNALDWVIKNATYNINSNRDAIVKIYDQIKLRR